MRPIGEVAAEKLGIPADAVSPYGKYKAKISLDYIRSLCDRPNGKLILVTAITPTPAGEGKTTTTVGLGDALNLIGKKTMLCPREDGFDITAASQVMATFCLATDLQDLQRRLGNIVVGQTRTRKPVRAAE